MSVVRGRLANPRIVPWCLVVLGVLAAGWAAPYVVGDARAQADPGYVVVAAYPHDPEAYTQGLAFRGRALFEGTGLEGHSSLRRVDLETGQVRRMHRLPDRYFGEGITLIGDEVFQITWQEHKGWVYDARTFEKLRSFRYEGEGWGLTDDGRRLVMSDGTEVIRFRNARSFETIREITVTEDGKTVPYLNELEWVAGEIFANVFPTTDIVRIDPRSGEVVGRFSLDTINEHEGNTCQPEATNGIAYMRSQERLFVTGKYWCHLYEIELTQPPGDAASPSPSG